VGSQLREERLWHNKYMLVRALGSAALLIGLLAVMCAQTRSEAPNATTAPLTSPTVSFTLDFPGANPSHYVISVGRDGHGIYVSNGQLSNDSRAAEGPSGDRPSDSSQPSSASATPISAKLNSGDASSSNSPLEFTLSNRVRDQIFDLAQRAHYFSGKVDSGHKNIANTGAKTLAYKDGEHASQATYNYSPSVPVEQLTNVFQALSQTLEFGRRLSFFHKYQKTAIEEDLKRMEELQRENGLGDAQAIAPVLKQIADDQSVMNVARARAMRLLNAK